MRKRIMFPSVVVSFIAVGALVRQGMLAHIAALQFNHTGNLESTRALIDSGADLNRTAEWGSTPLMQSARSGDVAAVETLLSKKVDVNIQDESGRTALSWAINMYSISNNRCYNAVARSLIDHGADMRHKSRFGRTYLMMAIASGDPELAQILLAHGVDPNAPDNRGNTALMFTMAGRLPAKDACPLCKQLLASGANPAARNLLDQTAYEISQVQSDGEIKKSGAALLSHATHKIH